MRRSFWRWFVGFMVSTPIVVTVGLAWACVGLVSLTTSSSTVQPGGSVTVVGREFAQGAPIEIHLDSPTGPVLATVPPPTDTMTSKWTMQVTIPAATPAGDHLLVATQAYHYMNVGAPARAVLHVGTAAPAPAPAAPAPRLAKVPVDSGPSAGGLVLIALAVAAIGLVLAAAWSLMVSRRDGRRASAAVAPGGGR
jgi:hypothetical protein